MPPFEKPMSRADAIRQLIQIRQLPEYNEPTHDDGYGSPLYDEESHDPDTEALEGWG